MPIVLSESSLESSPTNVHGLINKVARYVQPGVSGLLNRLSDAVLSSDTDIPFEFENNGTYRGAWLGIGLEKMHVWDYDAGTKTATVQRAMDGSLAAQHEAGDLVYIHPRWTRYEMAVALQDEIRSWPTSLYAIGAYDLSVTSTQRDYDLPIESFTHILEVSAYTTVVNVMTTQGPTDITDYDVLTNQSTDNYPSSNAFIANYPQLFSGTLRILYAKPFSTSSWTEDTTVGEIGLTPPMEDVCVLGAAARLLPSAEIQRSDTQAQGQSRLSEEVPPNYALQTARELERLRDKRLGQEARRLRELFPYKAT